jgi:Calcineurin-like phosphoesterase
MKLVRILFAVWIAVVGYAYAEDATSFAIAVIGDNGCGCSEQGEVARRMIEWYEEKPFKIILMLGDNIYGKNMFLRGGNRKLFPDRFDKYYKPLIDRGVKFYAVLGNHDMETRDGRDEIEDKDRFNIIGKDGYYVYTPDVQVDGKPLVAFFGLNSKTLVGGKDTMQVAWLSKSLTQSEALWEIPFYHHPIYTPPGNHSDEEKMRGDIENIFVAAGVRVTFAGHNHFYARMKPQQNIIHFVSGGGGRKLETPKKDDRAVQSVGKPQFMYLEIYSEQINFWAIPSDGPPFDQGTILRTPPPATP